MNSENCFKKICLLIFVFLMVVASAKAAPTAYAEYQDGVLVFRYGEKPNKSNVYDASDTGSDPGWYDRRNSISTVMFDSSFITARPKSCHSWFRGMVNLTTMSGLNNFDTSNVTDMSYMFYGCASLKAQRAGVRRMQQDRYAGAHRAQATPVVSRGTYGDCPRANACRRGRTTAGGFYQLRLRYPHLHHDHRVGYRYPERQHDVHLLSAELR